MKVQFKIPPGALARVTAVDLETKKRLEFDVDCALVIEVEPLFAQPKANAEVLTGEVISLGCGVVDKFVLQVSGGTGKLSRKMDERRREVARVVPAIDIGQTPGQPIKAVEPPVHAVLHKPAKGPLDDVPF